MLFDMLLENIRCYSIHLQYYNLDYNLNIYLEMNRYGN